jgi:8-oxo-dGTP diphosphatase
LTIQATVCFIVKDGKVLLLKKSEGLFGQGKWNAPGGKVLSGEDPEHSAVREVLEETQLKVKHLEHVATVYFYKFDRRDIPDWTVSVFLSRVFEGTPIGGREGILEWFNVNALPFEEMWEDDQYWVKLALEGRRFEGWFYYTGEFKKLVDYKIEDRPLASLRA